MRRTFRTRLFSRWLRKSGLSDAALSCAVEEMERGLIDAALRDGALTEIAYGNETQKPNS